MVYKTLEKVSDYCQLLDKRKYPATTTQSGVTFTNNGDGTITLNGTAVERKLFHICSAPAIKGHKYLLSGCPEGAGYYKFILETSWGSDYGPGKIMTFTRDLTSGNCYITIGKNFVFSNVTFKPQLFDLTEMYGAGNEPTTVAEFREKFPNELYDYKPYCFVKSYKNLLKANDNTIITSYKKSLVCTTNNLFDKSVFSPGSDVHNATLIDVKENGWIVQGKFGSSPGTALYDNGWFRPGDLRYDINNIGMLLHKAGKVTVSAYYTVLENNSISTANIYLYGTRQKVATHPDMLPDVGIKTRRYMTFDINDGEEGIYYPIFTLNSSKILIEDIQVEYGATPTEYHSYGYL